MSVGSAIVESPESARLYGGVLEYTLRRTPRARGVRVTIDSRRGVVVSVPPASRRGWARPESEIERFLRDRERWLRRHLERQRRDRETLAARGGLADGSRFRYRGEMHTLRVEMAAGRRSTVARIGSDDGDEIAVHLVARDRERVADVLTGWLEERARMAIEQEIGRHAGAIGVRPAAVAVRDPRSRWGSASRDGRLMFSWRLVLAPPEALETVVVHELAHLRVFGHGPRFWALVASRRPDHAEQRRWLRRHSYELHHSLDEPGSDGIVSSLG
jgi:predicted metal-dependent hydrolase